MDALVSSKGITSIKCGHAYNIQNMIVTSFVALKKKDIRCNSFVSSPTYNLEKKILILLSTFYQWHIPET